MHKVGGDAIHIKVGLKPCRDCGKEMRTLSQEEQVHFKEVLDEFSGLTNEEAYVHVFSKRMMKPVPNRIAEYYGSDQRIDMLPFLKCLVNKLPDNGQVFDVGAGSGDVIHFALQYAPKNTVINIEEPNSILIKNYLQTLKRYPHLRAGIVYDGPLQSFYRSQTMKQCPAPPQNLILAIHMIYHLTDFTTPQIDPENDIIEAISFLYELLTPGASLFIVYADLLGHAHTKAVCSMAEMYFREKYPHDYFADHLVSIYKARNHLLGPKGQIETDLKKRFPYTRPKLTSELRKTHFFGESVADIAVLGLATELCLANKDKFELAKLQFCLDYVSRHPESIGLVKETGNVPQKGYWRANEPQVIATLTKFEG